MSILYLFLLIILLCVMAGAFLWAANYLVKDPEIRKVMRTAVIVVLVVSLFMIVLNAFGVLGSLGNVRVPRIDGG